ncbi:unnamed protein product [Kuraishia capsulata CBS 1993]|uniref:Large ribosomal subunit protein mL53 n=1 Tax=Kuraishia capsulata CBS 1993 TaxID=1382522 RepID=W6MQ94_9ASCO|nr:uncharacterized protein KUCA_T00004846001 [Kuraishia capsulata CBS 1993]CDK28861.1 unnamed protein product [Kuraishia capsulata CBS 1993]
MLTKYFTKVTVRFNPFLKEAKPARLFLSSIPPSMRQSCIIDFKILSEQSKEKPIISVTFKDKEVLEVNPSEMNFADIADTFDRHAKKIRFKEQIES